MVKLMKYHDSIKAADNIMVLVVAQLKKWQLAISPINYAVTYEYYKKNNTDLIELIEQELKRNNSLSHFFMENLHKDQMLEQSKFREEIINDLSQLLASSQRKNEQYSHSAHVLTNELDNNIPLLLSNNKNYVSSAITALLEATKLFKQQQAQLAAQLAQSQQKNEKLAGELTKFRQEVNIDPVTGLFNQKAMLSHIEIWQTEEQCSITAILVKVIDFNKLNQKFGAIFSDVILARIANKIASYVNDSGLPVRLGYDEFILFLPNIDTNVANEIGNKINQAINKMRFVSAKSAIEIPQMAIDFSANHKEVDESIDDFIERMRAEI
jgi:diguanylate cyclase